jgi:hypothetical protein
VIAKGTWTHSSVPEKPGAALADGFVQLLGQSLFSGDLVGTEFWTSEIGPPDSAGVRLTRGDSTVTATLVGVGDGSFTFHEKEHPPVTDPNAATTVDVVGTGGVFAGMTGTLTFTDAGGNGTYEFHFVWK